MIYVNVVLTAHDEGDVETIAELLARQAALSREEPGCARFEVYHSRADRRVFMLVERWETQADLERHRGAEAFTELYVPKVLPLVERVPHESDLIA